jgi:acyl-CoA thioesterase-1
MNTRGLKVTGPLLAAITVACGSSSTPAGPAPPAPLPRQIVVLGDSLAVSPSKEQAFPAVLQARIRERDASWQIVNAGVSGDTTAGGLRRLDAVLTNDTAILVLALGANDGLRGVPASSVERNLASIIERAQARDVRVLLCGMETPPFNGWDYTVAFHEIFPRLAAKYTVPLVPFLLTGVALNPELNGADRIHPNAGGAQRIAETVWTYLEPMLLTESMIAGFRDEGQAPACSRSSNACLRSTPQR